jgi:ADP-heptose:LPS heptosyltransferase
VTQETALTLLGANIAGLLFRLVPRRPFKPPRKALILKPSNLSQVVMATPMLSALSQAYPQARFDWAVGERSRSAVVANPRLEKVIDAGYVTTSAGNWEELRTLTEQIGQEGYDTCFIPDRSSILSYIAWRAGIPQRVGLNVNGRGFAHTIRVNPKGEQHEAAAYMSLARAVGVDAEACVEFYPTEDERRTARLRLVDELDWQGILPLVLMHAGGGLASGSNGNSSEETDLERPEDQKRWPVARFALLGSRLAREYGAQLILVGSEQVRPQADEIAGLISTPTSNWAGKLSLGQFGALCELADLYVGSDTGPTHVAAAMGCPTLAIFGPSDPAVSQPISPNGSVVVLQPEQVEEPFSWEQGVMAEEAIGAAEELLVSVQEGRFASNCE